MIWAFQLLFIYVSCVFGLVLFFSALEWGAWDFPRKILFLFYVLVNKKLRTHGMAANVNTEQHIGHGMKTNRMCLKVYMLLLYLCEIVFWHHFCHKTINSNVVWKLSCFKLQWRTKPFSQWILNSLIGYILNPMLITTIIRTNIDSQETRTHREYANKQIIK